MSRHLNSGHIRPRRLVARTSAFVAFMALGAVLTATAHAQSSALPLKHAPRPTGPRISAEDLMTRLYIFADDSMDGREYQHEGNVKATNYLAAELKKLGLEPAGESGTYFQTLPFDSTREGRHPARNVMAILRGTDPKLNRTYVAIGSHNDHFSARREAVDHDSLRAWLFEEWSVRRTPSKQAAADSLIRAFVVNMDSLRRLRPTRRDSIVNGADDDGSGSVAVLEIAEALARLPEKPKRSILFVFHTGEEASLRGSLHFMAHPTVPRDSIITYVNLDMVGRGGVADTPEGGADSLWVLGGRQFSTELGRVVETVNTGRGHHLRLKMSPADKPSMLLSRSDQYSYLVQGIPIIFFFTGLHADYHRVTDEPQYINYPHLTKITKYVYDVMLALGSAPTRPVWDGPVAKPAP